MSGHVNIVPKGRRSCALMVKTPGQTCSHETASILKSEATAEAVGVFIAESSRMGCSTSLSTSRMKRAGESI